MTSGMADLICRHCHKRFGFSYVEPLPAFINCAKCSKPNDTMELGSVLDDLRRMREQHDARLCVEAFSKAGMNTAEIAAHIGIKEGRVRPFLVGTSHLTDDEFRTVSAALNLPVPFRTPSPRR